MKFTRLCSILGFFAGILMSAQGVALTSLQLYVDLTREGGVLRPDPGFYAGPVVIDRPMTIDGQGLITLDAGGSGSVISVKADGVTIRNMHLTNSGNSHNDTDAAILVEANNTRIENNIIDNSLFGIHLRGANNNLVSGNRITSKDRDLSMRGDGIRLWYSHDNVIEKNEVSGVRDLVFSNSSGNRIRGNTIKDSRVAMEFVFSPENIIEENAISHNTRGIVIIYSDDLIVRKNSLKYMWGLSAMALSLKESSTVLIEENEILYCTVGVGANAPTHPQYVYTLRGNKLAYNNIAFYFYGEKGGHVLSNNRLDNNMVDIAVSAEFTARANVWDGNYWDNYQGFDLDDDGRGDTPHEVYLYSDRLWMDRPMTGFFRGSPVMEMLDFVERFLPYSKPALILREAAPRVE